MAVKALPQTCLVVFFNPFQDSLTYFQLHRRYMSTACHLKIVCVVVPQENVVPQKRKNTCTCNLQITVINFTRVKNPAGYNSYPEGIISGAQHRFYVCDPRCPGVCAPRCLLLYSHCTCNLLVVLNKYKYATIFGINYNTNTRKKKKKPNPEETSLAS